MEISSPDPAAYDRVDDILAAYETLVDASSRRHLIHEVYELPEEVRTLISAQGAKIGPGRHPELAPADS